MKNIAVIVKYFYPVAAGIETNILETYSVLAQNGWNVTIYTSNDSLTEHAIYPEHERVRGLTVRRMPVRQWLLWPRGIDWHTTDIVCLHNFNVMPHFLIMIYALFLRLFKKKTFKMVLTPHGGFNPEWSIFHPFIAYTKRLYHYTLGALLINTSVDGVRAVSQWERKEMSTHHILDRKIAVISNGLEDEAYGDVDANASTEIQQRVKTLGRYIIQIGRIYMIKNYETTIRALPHMPADISFVIVGPVGDMRYKTKLEKLADELGVRNRVIFFGVIRGVDKYYLIRHALLMVHMALWESFCNAVHEGMSQGCVCLVADNTALPYLIKNEINGYCLPTRDSTALAQKISYIADHINTPEIHAMRELNRQQSLQYSWASVAKRMDDWYRNLLL